MVSVSNLLPIIHVGATPSIIFPLSPSLFYTRTWITTTMAGTKIDKPLAMHKGKSHQNISLPVTWFASLYNFLLPLQQVGGLTSLLQVMS